MKNYRKIIYFSLTTLLIFICWFFLIKDDRPLDDSDIYLRFIPAPRENNGLILLSEIAGKVQTDDQELQKLSAMIKKEPIDYQAINQVTDRYQKELNEFFKVADLPYFGYVSIDEEINEIKILSLISIAMMKGKIAIHRGKLDDAIEIGVYLVKLGYKFEHCQGELFHNALGMAIKKRGLELISEVANRGMSDEKRLAIRERILEYSDSVQGNILSLRYEYSYRKDEFLKPSKLSRAFLSDGNKVLALLVYLPVLYKPNRTTNKYADKFRELIKFQLGTRKEPIEDNNPFQLSFFLSGNLFGEVLLSLPPAIDLKPRETEILFQKVIKELEKAP